LTLQVQKACIFILAIGIAQAMKFSFVRSFLLHIFLLFLIMKMEHGPTPSHFPNEGSNSVSFVDPHLGLVTRWWSSGFKVWLLLSWFLQASSPTRRWFCCRES